MERHELGCELRVARQLDGAEGNGQLKEPQGVQVVRIRCNEGQTGVEGIAEDVIERFVGYAKAKILLEVGPVPSDLSFNAVPYDGLDTSSLLSQGEIDAIGRKIDFLIYESCYGNPGNLINLQLRENDLLKKVTPANYIRPKTICGYVTESWPETIDKPMSLSELINLSWPENARVQVTYGKNESQQIPSKKRAEGELGD